MSYVRKLPEIVLWLLPMLLFFSQAALSKNLGIYGVDTNSPVFSTYAIDAVFVPPQPELIAAQTAVGRKVYLTLNAFGGSEGWKKFPDARPVKADGEYLDSTLGGICPTHEGWRRSRLDIVSSWLEKLRGYSGIDGIWLDFIRYPGLWEKRKPDIPDTCYCPRCLTKFQVDSGIRVGDEAKTVAEKANWIQANAFLPWMKWKKEQIAFFAREVKQRIRQSSGDRQILLGAFLVPWRKADYNGALSFYLGQDAQLLAPSIDVFSPMVYHQMVERPVEWIGGITDYFAEMTGRPVWPIIQAEKVGGKEFDQIMQVVSRPAAQGLLVYKFSDMHDEHWPLLAKYQVSANLLQNPLLLKNVDGAVKDSGENTSELPDKWQPAPAKSVQDSKFLYEARDQGNVIGLTAGHDRQAVWSTGLPDCLPGASYLFSADFLREDRLDAQAYPEISLWGQEYRLNTHRMVGKFQKLKAVVTCPKEYREDEKQLQFRNNSPGNVFWMRSPELVARESGERLTPVAAEPDFFPIGIYGASSKNLHEIQALGLNTAVIGMTKENIETCFSLNMHCTIAVPHDPETLLQAFAKLKPLLQKGRFSYYVNDEPEIHSFPEEIAEDIQRIIKQHFPDAITNMAVVRPQAIPFYEKAADYFMLDQYPVPHMPMAWLSESMDEAARHVGRDRLQSVIQAFGDEKHAEGGWPRLPTHEEMSCLAFLSVVHGSRGIYFFTYPSITSTETGKDDLSRLVRQLNSMKSWLQVHNDKKPVVLRMISPNRFDPRGNPAVHCTGKEQYTTQMLVCVNTIATFTEAEIEIPAERQTQWRDYYTEQPYMVADGNILARFAPYEVKVLLELK
ncbi:hypothetical protein HGB07_00220 [Candidatus Roizmanbacteria bacterium]|nr:hypothetical protein [Candidatus Roizmanbacteria bacterium]